MFVPTYDWKMATKKVDKKMLLKWETGRMMRQLLFVKFWWIQRMDSYKCLNPKLCFPDLLLAILITVNNFCIVNNSSVRNF